MNEKEDLKIEINMRCYSILLATMRLHRLWEVSLVSSSA
jgi:hypothetical protein